MIEALTSMSPPVLETSGERLSVPLRNIAVRPVKSQFCSVSAMNPRYPGASSAKPSKGLGPTDDYLTGRTSPQSVRLMQGCKHGEVPDIARQQPRANADGRGSNGEVGAVDGVMTGEPATAQ